MKNKEIFMVVFGIIAIILGVTFQVWRVETIAEKMNISFLEAMILFMK